MGDILDNYDLWERHDREREEKLEKYPKCDYCKEPITDEYLYNVAGMVLCEDCIEKFRERTEDYVEE